MFICKIYKKTEEYSLIFQNSFFQNNCFYHVYWIVFQNLAFSLVDRLISMAGIQTVSSRFSSFFKEKKTSVCSNYYLTQRTVCHTFAGTSSDERANSYHKSFVTYSLPCLKVAYQLKTEKKGKARLFSTLFRFSWCSNILHLLKNTDPKPSNFYFFYHHQHKNISLKILISVFNASQKQTFVDTR